MECGREHRPQGSKCDPSADSVGMRLRLVMEILLRVRRSRKAGDCLEGTAEEKALLIQKIKKTEKPNQNKNHNCHTSKGIRESLL